jgi:Predicted hydrolases or acyltransferases (alpha/beta hydrolase superfamily)
MNCITQNSIDLTQNSFTILKNDTYHYSIKGSGKKVLLFIHGFGLSSFSFSKVNKEFNLDEYTLITIDLKGNGYSAKPKKSDYSIKEQGELIKLFLSKFKINEVNLIGHSYGGLVSLYLTYLQLERKLNFRINSLTLIDSPAYTNYTPVFVKVLQNRLGAYIFLKIIPPRILAKLIIRNTFYDKKFAIREYLPLYNQMFSQPGYDHSMPQIAQQLLPVNAKEIIASYVKIDIPVLIIWGKEDRVVDISQGEKLNNEINNSQFIVLENTEHVPHEEKPKEVYLIINQFLSR